MRDRPFQLMLVDADPVFRLGLRIWLEQFADFSIAAEASTGAEALTYVQQRHRSAAQGTSAERPSSSRELASAPAEGDQRLPPFDLVIIDMGLGQQIEGQMMGLQLCQQIRDQAPTLAIVVISAEAVPVLREAARRSGATAFGTRGMPITEMIQLIRRAIAQGASPPAITFPSRTQDIPAQSTAAPGAGPWHTLRQHLHQSGLQQIDQGLGDIETALAITPSLVPRLVLAGRRRELRAARWLTQRLWSTPPMARSGASEQSQPGAARPPRPNQRVLDDSIGASPSAEASIDSSSDRSSIDRSSMASSSMTSSSMASTGALRKQSSASLEAAPSDIQALVFRAVFQKLQHSLDNHTGFPLEIDILRSDQRRELLYMTLRQWEEQLSELYHSQVQPGQLRALIPAVLRQVWQGVTHNFLGKYATVQWDGVEQGVVDTLLADGDLVEQTMLSRLPLVPELIGHLMFAEPLAIDGTMQAATSYEALVRSQHLLENVLIQVACSVVQPLLNHFADVETFKKRLYHRQILSTREITRFRNNLSWRYRWDQAIDHPKAIFESQHRLFIVTETGMHTRYVYAPRRQELERLSGVQYGVTLVLEARDAIAPRLQSVVALVGSGLVYVLTEVVGRGLGLVGRGILQGIGNAWHEGRPKRQRRE